MRVRSSRNVGLRDVHSRNAGLARFNGGACVRRRRRRSDTRLQAPSGVECLKSRGDRSYVRDLLQTRVGRAVAPHCEKKGRSGEGEMSKLLAFMKKNDLFFRWNAIWQYDKKWNVSTMIYPSPHRVRLWQSRRHAPSKHRKPVPPPKP